MINSLRAKTVTFSLKQIGKLFLRCFYHWTQLFPLPCCGSYVISHAAVKLAAGFKLSLMVIPPSQGTSAITLTVK